MNRGCRIFKVSVLVVIILIIILSFYNIILTLKALLKVECKNIPKIKNTTPKIISNRKCENIKINDGIMPLINLNLNLGRWDNRLQYKLFDNIIIGEKYIILNEYYQTCLATQSSLERIISLIQVVENWNGPISCALFASSDDELNALLLFIIYLRECNKKIKEQVNFHFAYSKDRKLNNINVNFDKINQMNCNDPLGVLKDLVKDNIFKWRAKIPYPQNHLRNLARKNCQTKYNFLTDIDIIPSKNMAEKIDQFLLNNICDGLCAYVIPTYELDERVHFPFNKTDLIRLANKGLARPFHQKVFIYNQYATNFSRWQNTKEQSNVHISHPVTNFEFLYEPFYVAPDTVPPHDERFVGYGYTRNSQVYEMFVAGYEFLVLSPIFTCHWGLQVKKTRPPWREHQNNLNRRHFDAFKREIFAKYNKDPLNMISKKT